MSTIIITVHTDVPSNWIADEGLITAISLSITFLFHVPDYFTILPIQYIRNYCRPSMRLRHLLTKALNFLSDFRSHFQRFATVISALLVVTNPKCCSTRVGGKVLILRAFVCYALLI